MWLCVFRSDSRWILLYHQVGGVFSYKISMHHLEAIAKGKCRIPTMLCFCWLFRVQTHRVLCYQFCKTLLFKQISSLPFEIPSLICFLIFYEDFSSLMILDIEGTKCKNILFKQQLNCFQNYLRIVKLWFQIWSLKLY